jgi:hypothetical protein
MTRSRNMLVAMSQLTVFLALSACARLPESSFELSPDSRLASCRPFAIRRTRYIDLLLVGTIRRGCLVKQVASKDRKGVWSWRRRDEVGASAGDSPEVGIARKMTLMMLPFNYGSGTIEDAVGLAAPRSGFRSGSRK